jgi:RNA polymerase sigma-70 factor (ECF subfamily)
MRVQDTTGETTSDWSMLERIQQKEEEALSALYDRYSGLVFSEAKRILRDTGAAEEILEDLFYQVWQTPGRSDPTKGSLAGWLLVAARNRAISKLRRRSEDLEENGVSLNMNIESHAAQKLLVDKVRKVLGSLPAARRESLECAYFEGMSHSEITEKTGQPVGAVKAGIRGALESLKKVLA